METFTLEMPKLAIVVESRDVALTVNVVDLPHDILRQLIPHGIKQKLADSAASVPFTCYMASKPDGTPKPSRDQLTDWVAANQKTVNDGILAAMQKAWDAMVAGQWQVRVSGGTSTKMTDEQALAVQWAKNALTVIFSTALAKAEPTTKPTAAAFMELSPKVAAFFKANEKRPTWDDKAVIAWIGKQAAAYAADPKTGRDFMAEAREELARQAAAIAATSADLDDLLGDI